MPKKKTKPQAAETNTAVSQDTGVPYRALRDPASPINRVLPAIFFALAAVLFLSYLFPDLLGIVGQALRNLSFGLFSWACFLIPVILVLLAITRKRDVTGHVLTAKYISAVLLLLFLSVFVFVVSVPAEARESYFRPDAAFVAGVQGLGGGFFGSILGFCLVTALSTVGTVILFLLALVFFLIAFFNFEPRAFCVAAGKTIARGAKRLFRSKPVGEKKVKASGENAVSEGAAAEEKTNAPIKNKPSLSERMKSRFVSLFRPSERKPKPLKLQTSVAQNKQEAPSVIRESEFQGIRPEPLKPRRATFAAMPDGDSARPDIDGTVSARTLNPMEYPLDNDIFYADARSSERFSQSARDAASSYDYSTLRKESLIQSRESDLRAENPRSLEEYANITVTDPRSASPSGGFTVQREAVGGFGNRSEGSYGGSPFGFDNFTMPVHPSRETAARVLPGDTPIEQIVPDDDSLAIPRPAAPAAQFASPSPAKSEPYKPTDFGYTEERMEKPSENPYVFANPYISEETREPVGSFTREVPQYPRREEYSAQPAPAAPSFGGGETSHVTTYYRTPQAAGAETASPSFDFSRYRYPDISFLTPQDRTDDSALDEEVAVNMERLIDTLKSYGVVAEPRSTTRGPRVTRYEIKPAIGVRISSITNLQNEIAMNLSAESLIIEAPIPGDSAIGIQVPNARTKPVRLRALIDSDAFRNAKSPTTIALGADIAGKHVFTSISEMPHLLVAGATGMGKSVCINTIITSILYKARPDEVRLILVDPKMVEFNIYQGIPHLLVPVINDAKQAIGALNWAVDEMNRRFKLIASVNARDLDGYGDAQKKNPELEPLPRIVIVIDELNDLVLSLKNSRPLDDVICRIAQKARAAGIHLIIGTQRPTVNVITGNIKANIPARMAFKVAQKVDSTTIIDAVGAEKLLDKGDMLFMRGSKLRRVQCCLVDNTEIEKIVQFLAANSEGNIYDENAMAGIQRATNMANQQENGKDAAAAPENGGHMGSEEKMFWKAVDILLSFDKVSTSLLERKLGVGYGRASKLIDKMEDLGIVSPQDGKKARELLLTPDEVAEMRANLAGRQLFGVAEEDGDDGDAPF